MKRLTAILFFSLAGAAFALDDQGWLEKARECVRAGQFLDSDETKEDGVYCMSIAPISASEGKTTLERVGEAELEAKRKLTAYVHGETMTASRTVDQQRETTAVNGETAVKGFSRFQKKIESKVDAFVRGTKIIGQITYSEVSYIVCVTTERYEDDSSILRAAQSEYGNEGVVKAVGEAETVEAATQKALRGAVEQVLGTVVVGYDAMSSDAGFQSRFFSGTDGVVEKYRVLSETNVSIGKRIVIVAKVSKKTLLDNYSNYMHFVGDPAFYIDSNSPDLASHFTQFFTDMGIRMAPDPDQSSFVIHCAGEFRPLKHPASGRQGTQLSLRFKVNEINGADTLIDMKNDPRKSACFTGKDPDRQKEICSEKAFKQMEEPLHQKIQAMVAKLVGRKMRAAAQGKDDSAYGRTAVESGKKTGFYRPTVSPQEQASSSSHTGGSSLFETVKKSLIFIRTESGRGSGFIAVDKGRKFVYTNMHMLLKRVGNEMVAVTNLHAITINSDEVVLGKVQWAKDQRDVVRFPTESELPALEIDEALPEMKEDVIIIGDSEGEGAFTEARGHVLAVGPQIFEHDADTAHGNSGSPVLNVKGCVIGLDTRGQSSNKSKGQLVKDSRYNFNRNFATRLGGIEWTSEE